MATTQSSPSTPTSQPLKPTKADATTTTVKPTRKTFKPTPEIQQQLNRVALSSRSPFEKRVYSTLCQVPPGRFTTYAALAAHLKSSPRAIGNAMRRNPFAPGVPCHRVVATGGGLGGFKGKWPRVGKEGKEGITLVEKRDLLKGEGVRFDGDGAKVFGVPFTDFV